MDTPASSQDSTLLAKADRIGIGASILCAIHCAAAPFSITFTTAFGKIWAHPLSHILVAMLVVPLAAFSIRRGYLTHQKKWVLVTAYIGIFVVLTGATLPAFSKEPEAQAAQAGNSQRKTLLMMVTKVNPSSLSQLMMIQKPKKQKLKKSLFSLFLLMMMPNRIPQKVNTNSTIMLSHGIGPAPAYGP